MCKNTEKEIKSKKSIERSRCKRWNNGKFRASRWNEDGNAEITSRWRRWRHVVFGAYHKNIHSIDFFGHFESKRMRPLLISRLFNRRIRILNQEIVVNFSCFRFQCASIECQINENERNSRSARCSDAKTFEQNARRGREINNRARKHSSQSRQSRCHFKWYHFLCVLRVVFLSLSLSAAAGVVRDIWII